LKSNESNGHEISQNISKMVKDSGSVPVGASISWSRDR